VNRLLYALVFTSFVCAYAAIANDSGYWRIAAGLTGAALLLTWIAIESKPEPLAQYRWLDED
jgi:hypothetical protein